MTNEGVCLDAAEELNQTKNVTIARIVTCADSPRQYWIYDMKSHQIRQRVSGNCLTASKDIESAIMASIFGYGGIKESNFNVTVAPCTDGQLQKWLLFPLNWK